MSKDQSELLVVENLSYRSQGKIILEEISFKLYPGQVTAIVGPSGAGKSTLLRLLNRLDEPTDGSIYINGRDYREISPRDLRRQVGLVFQTAHLFPGSVADNLRYAPALRGEVIPDNEIRQILKQVGLQGFEDRDVSRLSGGEAQRVSLARTLVNQPCILLLDEPTASLDSNSKSGVEELLLEIFLENGQTCLIVTHDPEQAKRLASHVILIQSGHLEKYGTVEEVLNAKPVV